MFGIPFVDKIADAVFGGDPVPKPKAPEPKRPEGLYLPNVGEDFAYRPMNHRELYEPQSGFGHGYKLWQQQSVMDKPFTAQWQTGPNGPQWVEPVRKSAGAWDSRVVSGPIKGNRI